MSFSANVDSGMAKEKLYAAVKPQPQLAQQVAEQAVQAKDQKSSGVAWTKKGNETVVSTQEEADSLVLSATSISLTAPSATPTVNPSASVKQSLNNFRQSLVNSLYDGIETAIRREYSHDAMQARFGASDLDSLMSKLFMRLGPSLLSGLGEDPAGRIAGIRERVVTQLKTENLGKMESCELTRARLEIYGQA